ncbi:apolipoprotein(a)-like isoform X2 [Mercenaria mercenaria]|nr:apolipoprotein(a)-like isoform X2 [Mercenaria mercenaria]
MMGGCAAHNCQNHQLCLPLGHSDFQCVDKENCGPAPTIGHGTVSAPITTDGAAATYSCIFGYEIVDDVTTKRCKAGTWTGETIVCSLKDCGPLADVTYGTVSAPVTTHGASATFSCQYGYGFTSGDSTRTCVDGIWSGVQPTCTIKDCGYLPGITDGSVHTPVTTHGAVAVYECDFGYQITSGDSTRTCDDGTWGGAGAVCTPIPNIGCYTVGYSYLYEGTRHHSQSGYLCQSWDAQSPHGHDRTNPANFPDDSLSAAENYCRDPDREGGAPWCYTTDPGVRWELCGVQSC